MDEHASSSRWFSSREEIELACIRNLLSYPGQRLFFKDLDSRFLLVSTAFLEEITPGLALEDVIGKTDFDIFSAPHATEAFADEQEVIRTGEPLVGKVERETYYGRPDTFVSTTKLPLRDGQGRIIGTFGISRDVTAEIEAREALARQALTDPVTGLANRLALMDRLALAILGLERRSGRVGVLFIDLDNFKGINDAFGHEVGDRVLAEVGRRLSAVARRGDTVARFGGDEFVLLCALREDEDVRLVADRMMRSLRAPLHELTITVSGSIGAVATSDPLASAGQLVQQADLAMYAAKRAGGDTYSMYEPELHGQVASEGGLAADLRHAITRGELFVVYQPLFRLDDGALTGVEALVRWRHPKRGIIGAAEFIALAEKSGLISEIDAFVLDEACRQLAEWTRADPSWEECTMAVNLSARQLRDAALTEHVLGTLKRHRLAPARLCLEITETALIGEPSGAHRILERLSQRGVRIALDDFGTGYSTLAHLQQLRVDILKIDRSFVAQLGCEPRDREIIAAVTAMSHALGMTVVAEGVETDIQRAELAAVACDQVQGYLFAAPMAPGDIERLWDTSRSSARAA